MFQPEKIFEKNPDFVQREIAGEFLLIPIRRQLSEANALYVMNETGTAFWKRLDGTTTVADIKTALLSEYEVSEDALHQDLTTLVDDLVSIQAIREKSS